MRQFDNEPRHTRDARHLMATSIVMLVITALLTLTVVTSALGAGMEELAFEVALGTWIANS